MSTAKTARKSRKSSKNVAPYGWAKCPGEAHSNPFIDGCMCCINYSWGLVPALSPEETKAQMEEAQAK